MNRLTQNLIQITVAADAEGNEKLYGLTGTGEVFEFVQRQQARGIARKLPSGEFDNSMNNKIVGHWTPYWKKVSDDTEPTFVPNTGYEELDPVMMQTPY